ncbi:MAG: PEP-CTERM system histidine kinase PrsK [Desulfobacterales bacterium]|nr:PEP-CTERM system histidine kinase PrsK [Desulfobacterales bacterium]
MAAAIYTLNLLLLFSCLADERPIGAERRFSFMLLRLIACIPLLAGQYAFFYFQPLSRMVAPLFFSECVFGLLLLLLNFRLRPILYPEAPPHRAQPWLFWSLAAGASLIGGFWLWTPPGYEVAGDALLLPYSGQLYAACLLVLITILVAAWRLEMFWRRIGSRERRPYKYVVIGLFLILGSLAWSLSYRLAYLRVDEDHLLLLAIFLGIGWLIVVHAVARHRLLNRKVFVSRRVIYSTLTPLVCAVYLLLVGSISLVMRTFGWSLPFVLQWLLIVMGLLALVVLTLSTRVRTGIKYYISTHFYLNKYEYREEWLAFSELLQGKLTEAEVAEALRRILRECLYTRILMLWLEDGHGGFRLLAPPGSPAPGENGVLTADDPLLRHLQNAPYIYMRKSGFDPEVQRVFDQKQAFFSSTGLVLLYPLVIGTQCMGLIGLGPEYTGGTYGRDDFDLLAALGSQAAWALLAVRNAERLALAREQSAWNTLSAFVLHDIKNAATMLGLVRQNAPEHIHDPEFQQDMLVSIDDALKRMNKVQARLNTLKGEIVPVLGPLALAPFLDATIRNLAKKLPRLSIALVCPVTITIQTDPDFLTQILENLLLNSLEAGSGGNGIKVKICVTPQSPQDIEISITDNGPGIPSELLPDRLFEPFATTKERGSGIGLWQVKQLVEILGGTVTAGNPGPKGGGCFQLRLPLARHSK